MPKMFSTFVNQPPSMHHLLDNVRFISDIKPRSFTYICMLILLGLDDFTKLCFSKWRHLCIFFSNKRYFIKLVNVDSRWLLMITLKSILFFNGEIEFEIQCNNLLLSWLERKWRGLRGACYSSRVKLNKSKVD